MPKQTATLEIRKLQQKLLDLSYRNRLLNLNYEAKSLLRFIDEIPAILFSKLSDNKSLLFVGVPQPEPDLIKNDESETENNPTDKTDSRPSVSSYAKLKGINPSYELTEKASGVRKRSHTDNKIQSLMYPDDLDSRLGKIYGLYKSLIEETGANSLYVSFGALEYTASEFSNEKKRAPLLLVPVNISRKRNVPFDEFSISSTGDEPGFNISLIEKLRAEFNITLPTPALDVDEHFDLDKFFKSVQKSIKKVKPEWKVIWEANLAILNFGKILLYKDLALDFWEKEDAQNHPVLSRILFDNNTDQQQDNRSCDYPIDDCNVDSVPPLVLDADSSQHSAIIDALNGKNLVIQGPPGTGKSQTITNLIAAAIGTGKTVLFIAEKLTALEVVKKRLEVIGLGDFCCEIHSTKTQKSTFYEAFKSRIDSTYSTPKMYEKKRLLLDNLKDRIKSYIKEIQHIPEGFEQTVFSLIGKHAVLKNQLEHYMADLDSIRLQDNCKLNAKELEIESQSLKAHLEVLISINTEFGSRANHPWSLIGNGLFEHSAYKTSECLGYANKIIERLDLMTKDLLPELKSFLNENILSLSSLIAMQTRFQSILKFCEEPDVERIAILVSQLPKIALLESQRNISAIIDIEDSFPSMFTNCSSLLVYDDLLLHQISAAFNFKHHANLLPLKKLPNFLTEAINLSKAAHDLEQIILTLPNGLDIDIISEIPIEQLKFLFDTISSSLEIYKREPDISLAAGNAYLDRTQFQECYDAAEKYSAQRAVLAKVFFDDIFNESYSEVFEKSKILRQASWFTLIFNRKVRSAYKWAKSAISKSERPKFTEILILLKDLCVLQKSQEIFNANQNYPKLFGSAFKKFETRFDLIGEAMDKLGRNVEDLQKIKCVGLTDIAKLVNFCKQVSDSNHSVTNLKDTLMLVLKIANTVLGDNSGQMTIQGILQVTNSILIDLKKAVALLPQIDQLVNPMLTPIDLQFSVEGVIAIKSLRRKIGPHELVLRSLDCDFENTRKALERIKYLADLQESIETCGLIKQETLILNLTRIAPFLKSLPSNLEIFCMHISKVGLNLSEFSNTILGDLIDRIEYLRTHQDSYHSWMDYCRSLQRISNGPFSMVVGLIEERVKDPIIGELIGKFIYIKHILERHISGNKQLNSFRGFDFEQIRIQYKETDLELLELNRIKIALDTHYAGLNSAPKGRSSNKKSELTELSLIENEISKESRYIPIRQLMMRAQNAAMAYKPCFMMSPLSVAQFLPITGPKFDIVVMDEASQITLETALGAIARGKQLIVVGDSKQLPPTSFFESQSNEDSEQIDDFVVADAESVLQFASKLFTERMLKWHYRSKHESLIAFSNTEFYGNQLILFPAASEKNDLEGIRFRRIEGVYQGSGVNQIEAREIVNSLKSHAINSPNLSIGIATMNKRQKEEIDNLIELECKHDPLLRTFLDSKPNGEQYFVKNLENVQGDERDVIFVSITYGKDVNGSFYHRFGPINSKYGPRRLNVLFSRARTRMELFCSFDPENLNGASSEGAKALQRFLQYARDGKLESPPVLSGRPPDSDFERSVASVVKSFGFEVVPQLGVAGYFIDIAVRDPRIPSKYILAIECDGATYHSSRSARDRDRLRQQNLEKLGWVVHRIWSTDWFKSRWQEENRLQSILEKLTGQLINVRKINSEPARKESTLRSDKLKANLVRLRTIKVNPGSPNVPREMGILRTEIIELILKHLPISEQELLKILSDNSLEINDHHSAYIPEIIELVLEHSSEPIHQIKK